MTDAGVDAGETGSTPTAALTSLARVMRLFLRAGHALLCAAVIGVASPACYTAGDGTPPPMDSFYFPTGLAVSPAPPTCRAMATWAMPSRDIWSCIRASSSA